MSKRIPTFVGARFWLVFTTVLCCAVGATSITAQEPNEYAGIARFEVDHDFISFPARVVGVYFDTSECVGCKSSLPEWRFIGDLKVDSLVYYDDAYPTRSEPVTTASEVEGLAINSSSLQQVFEDANALYLGRRVPHSVPYDTLVWNPGHSEWRVAPDLFEPMGESTPSRTTAIRPFRL